MYIRGLTGILKQLSAFLFSFVVDFRAGHFAQQLQSTRIGGGRQVRNLYLI